MNTVAGIVIVIVVFVEIVLFAIWFTRRRSGELR